MDDTTIFQSSLSLNVKEFADLRILFEVKDDMAAVERDGQGAKHFFFSCLLFVLFFFIFFVHILPNESKQRNPNHFKPYKWDSFGVKNSRVNCQIKNAIENLPQRSHIQNLR